MQEAGLFWEREMKDRGAADSEGEMRILCLLLARLPDPAYHIACPSRALVVIGE
jgi:hypothetical protein